MAGSLNKAILIGRLGADPEVRYTSNGNPVANFRMATSETWNDKQGQRQERTEWHRIVAWGKLGELCGQYLAKGRLVCVEGRLQTRQWEDRDGNKRQTTEIQAKDVQFLDSKGSSDSRQPSDAGGSSSDDNGYDYTPPVPDDNQMPF